MSSNNDFSTPEKAIIGILVAVFSYVFGKKVSDKEHELTYKKQNDAAKSMEEYLEKIKRGDFTNIDLYKLNNNIYLYNSSSGKDSLIEKGEAVLVLSSDENFYRVTRIKTSETGYLNKKFCKNWVKVNLAKELEGMEDDNVDDSIVVLSDNVDLYNSSAGKDPTMRRGELIEIISSDNNFYRVKRLLTGEVGYVNRRFVD